VVELSVNYEPASGVIEVVSPDRTKRDELARLFADTVLGHRIEGQRIGLREYDLSRSVRVRLVPVRQRAPCAVEQAA
jgi:hypothetical protein